MLKQAAILKKTIEGKHAEYLLYQTNTRSNN